MFLLDKPNSPYRIGRKKGGFTGYMIEGKRSRRGKKWLKHAVKWLKRDIK